MARRSEHSQGEIKQMVLNAAETIVIEGGFSELKVRKVAMEIGYTVGSIYMVFDNMADLIMHVKGKTLDDIAEQLKLQISDEKAEKIIAQLAKSYGTFATQHYNRWNMIFEHNLAEGEVIPEWYQKKVDDIFELVEFQFQRLLASRDNKQIKLAARTLWSGVHGVCTISLAGKMNLLGDNMDEAIKLLVNNFIKGSLNV